MNNKFEMNFLLFFIFFCLSLSVPTIAAKTKMILLKSKLLHAQTWKKFKDGSSSFD